MEYRVEFVEIEGVFSRDIEGAVAKLSEQVNPLLASGWVCQGGVAIGSAGTAPWLFQALVKK